MNLRKFLLGFAFVMVVSLFANNSALAVSKFSKAKNTIVAKVENSATSGDKKTTNELKEVVAEKAEKAEKVSGEKELVKASEEKETAKASGEEKAAKVEEKETAVVSGEKEEKVEEKSTKKEDKKVEEKATEKEEVKKEEAKKEEAKKEDTKKEETNKEDKKSTTDDKWKKKELDKKAWYYDYVVEAVDEDLMNLKSDGEFHPETVATKGDVADALYQIATRNDKKTSDKKEVDTYEWAQKHTLMTSKDKAEDELTREEVARYVYRYARRMEGQKLTVEEKAKKLSFEDSDKISKGYTEAVKWCALNKVIIGRPDNTVDAQADATRPEAATIFVRLNDVFTTTTK